MLNGEQPCILVFDDEQNKLREYVNSLKQAGFNAIGVIAVSDLDWMAKDGDKKPSLADWGDRAALTYKDIQDLLDEYKPKAVLTDYEMYDFNGIDVANCVRIHNPNIPCVIHTGAGEYKGVEGIVDMPYNQNTYKIASKQHGFNHIIAYLQTKIAEGRNK